MSDVQDRTGSRDDYEAYVTARTAERLNLFAHLIMAEH